MTSPCIVPSNTAVELSPTNSKWMFPELTARFEAGMPDAPNSGKSTVPFMSGDVVKFRMSVCELPSVSWRPTHCCVGDCASPVRDQRATRNTNVSSIRKFDISLPSTLFHVALEGFVRCSDALKTVVGWRDVFHAQIDFCLPAVMCRIRESPPEHFQPGGLPSLGNIKHLVQLFGRRGC